MVDLEVLADGGVEGVQRGLRVPEELGDVENVGRCAVLVVTDLRGKTAQGNRGEPT